ncbi:metallophosphoesterase [Roseivirga pacifica]
MKKLLSIALLIATFTAIGQQATVKIESITGPKPYTSLDLNNNPKNFQFAIVTDRTGGHRPGVFLDGVKKLNLLQPEFVMSVGDLIEGYTTNEERLDREWEEFNGFIDQLQMPFFYVPGNHDITNKVMEDKWKELYGKTYYSFVYQDVLFMCLNSEDNYRGSGRGTIGKEQYDWIKKTLAKNQDVKWTMFFLHQPLWAQEAETLMWPEVEKLLVDREHTVYAGHRHAYVQYERNNGKYYILATTGGGSSLRGPELGEFDHVVWITMTDEGPIMANLQLEGIWREDMVTDESKAFFSPMVSNSPLKVSPVLVDGGEFQNAVLKLKLTNDSNVPVTADLSFDYNPNLLPTWGKRSIEVAPNSVELIDVELESFKTDKVAEFNNLQLKGNFVYKPSNSPEVKADFNYGIRPESWSTIDSKKIQVDGDLSDWGKLSKQSGVGKSIKADPFSHQGSKDAAFQFDVAYDKDYVYLAANVQDDDIDGVQSVNPARQDGFHFILDAKGMDSAQATWGALAISTSPLSNGKLNNEVFRANRLPEGTKVVTKPTKSGYTVEVAVPISYVVEQQGANWKHLRINAYQTDFDKDKMHETTIYWRPLWNSAESFVGSGMFKK